jgi:hypothetical protein
MRREPSIGSRRLQRAPIGKCCATITREGCTRTYGQEGPIRPEGATLLSFDGGRIQQARYTETDHFRITRRFLMDHESVLQQLFAPEDEGEAVGSED